MDSPGFFNLHILPVGFSNAFIRNSKAGIRRLFPDRPGFINYMDSF